MRCGEVYVNGVAAGLLKEADGHFVFQYYDKYINDKSCAAVSLTLPKRKKAYTSPILFPFFAGLLAEGTAMRIQCRILKLDGDDLFGRLLKTAGDDVIGAVTVHEIKEDCR